jgi:hypothetical protein
MLITEKVNILITKNNFNFYEKIGYNPTIGEEIQILSKDLKSSSKVVVQVRCDFCQCEKGLSYRNYSKSLKSGGKYACSQKCSYQKKSEFLLQKEGIQNIFQSEKIKQKIKQKNLQKWGVDSFTKTKNFKEKAKKTNLEKFGVENPMQNHEVKERAKLTSYENWGGTGFASEKISEKIIQSNLEKWGTETPVKLESIKEKIKLTNLEKWGGTGFASEKISEKISETLQKNWGNISNTKSEIFRKLHYKISKDPNYIEYAGNRFSIFKCELGHTFSIHKNNYLTRKEEFENICTVCNPIGELSSIKEKELFQFIESLDVDITNGYRDGLEIDIYIKHFKIGFEFNGLYFHSDIFKDKLYHLNKTNFFKEKGIRIIHIWEDDWDNKKDIIKSQIRNILGMSNKIGSRKCQIKKVNSKEAKEFLESNHIQGSYSSIKESWGLYFQEELLSIMSFDQFEGRKKMNEGEWNLSRFCNKLNYSAQGGASKLLNHFIKIKSPKRIISYADKDWSSGNLYEKLKFTKINETKPDYKYILKKKRFHKSNFRKSRTGITESNLSLPKVWDCGKIKYEFILN